jgi:hypothetical protein
VQAAQVAELARRWAAEWEAFPGLRAAVDLTVRNDRGSRRAGAVLLLAPTALRVEIATPFGLPAVVGAATADGITVLNLIERHAHVGRATPEMLERWLGLRLAPETLIHLLVGQVPPPPDPALVTVGGGPTSHLTWTRDGVRHRVWVSAQGQATRLVLDGPGEGELVAEYERQPTGDLAGLSIAAPGKHTELTVRYLSAELVALPPEAFHVALPAGVPVVPFD